MVDLKSRNKELEKSFENLKKISEEDRQMSGKHIETLEKSINDIRNEYEEKAQEMSYQYEEKIVFLIFFLIKNKKI